MYSFGMSARDIQRHLQQVYGIEVSPETISNITDAVMSDVREWQNRPLEKSYPILFLDALRVNSRQDGKNINKALYVALAINWEGRKEVLGLWLADTEGAKFRMSVLTDIKNRGTEDILIACMDVAANYVSFTSFCIAKTRSIRRVAAALWNPGLILRNECFFKVFTQVCVPQTCSWQ